MNQNGSGLDRAISENPTPGPNRAASPVGTRNDVGYFPTAGDHNYVKSFTIPSPDAHRYTDITVNSTIAGEHGIFVK